MGSFEGVSGERWGLLRVCLVKEVESFEGVSGKRGVVFEGMPSKEDGVLINISTRALKCLFVVCICILDEEDRNSTTTSRTDSKWRPSTRGRKR